MVSSTLHKPPEKGGFRSTNPPFSAENPLRKPPFSAENPTEKGGFRPKTPPKRGVFRPERGFPGGYPFLFWGVKNFKKRMFWGYYTPRTSL